jgi:hypothetical protein
VHFIDAEFRYRARISWPATSRAFESRVVYVYPPTYLQHAVDSSVGYDEAAAAAISFADHQETGIAERAEWNEHGIVIDRKPPGRSSLGLDLPRELASLAHRAAAGDLDARAVLEDWIEEKTSTRPTRRELDAWLALYVG